MFSVLILRSRSRYYIGTCLMFWFYFSVKVLHWNMSYVLILRSCPKYYIGTCPMFWFYVPVHNITLEHVICSDFFTFPSKVLHWNMSSILTLRSRPSYCIGTCHMFWFYALVQTITLEHVYVLILLSRSKYYIGTCPMFWFYPPVQTITLEHVLYSNFTLPFKVLHWNMSYVLILRSRSKYYIGTCLMFWVYALHM